MFPLMSEEQIAAMLLLLEVVKLSLFDFKDYCREQNIVFNMSEFVTQIMIEQDRTIPISIDQGPARDMEEQIEFSKTHKLLHPDSK